MGTPTPWGANLLFGIISAENCMKMTIIGLRGDTSLVPLDQPLVAASSYGKYWLYH